MPDIAGVPLGTVLVATAIVAVGAAIQASLGLGLALFCVPLLGLADLRFLPGPMLFAAAGLSLGMAYRDRAEIALRDLGVSLAGLIVGTIAGAFLLSEVSGPHLGRVFGALILAGVSLSVSGLAIQPSRIALTLGGTASGIMGTMVGVHGPAIALVFQRADPGRVRGMLGAFFTVAYLIAVPALAALGQFGLQELLLGLALLPGIGVGFLLSPLLVRWVDAGRMRVLILGISAASAAIMIVRG